jgi:hypothetical protein
MTEMSLGLAGTQASSAPAGADDFAGRLHDLGHRIMTVSLLAQALHADPGMSGDSRQRTERGRDGGTTIRAVFGGQCGRILVPRSRRAGMAGS